MISRSTSRLLSRTNNKGESFHIKFAHTHKSSTVQHRAQHHKSTQEHNIIKRQKFAYNNTRITHTQVAIFSKSTISTPIIHKSRSHTLFTRTPSVTTSSRKLGGCIMNSVWRTVWRCSSRRHRRVQTELEPHQADCCILIISSGIFFIHLIVQALRG